MEMLFGIAIASVLVFVLSQAVIIYFLRKENKELLEILAEEKPPF